MDDVGGQAPAVRSLRIRGILPAMRGFHAPPSIRRRSAGLFAGLASLGLLLVPGEASAGVPPPAVIRGNIVLQQGQDPGGGAVVVGMNPPFVNAAGEVSFTGQLADGDHYLFIGNAVVWQGSDDAMFLLDVLEPRMDSSGMGSWVYPIDIDGADGLYTDAGPFAAAGDPIAALMGASYTFLGSPTMNADGAIVFVAGIDDTGDGVADRFGLFRTPDGSSGAVELIYAGNDPVDMITLLADGIDFDYAVSEDGLHLGTILYATGDSTSNAYVRIDDTFVARELDPTGDGDTWDNFDLIAVNGAGNYVFTGDTDGAAGSDEFLAYNATIVVREGDTIAGIDLPPGSNMRFAALSDLEQAAFAWFHPTPGGNRETVFFTCDTADFPGQTQQVFTTIDTQLDVDGDDMGDYTIVELTLADAVAGRAIGETPFVYAQVALDDGMGGVTAAMLEVPVSCCGNGAVNPFEECDDADDDDTDDCLSTCVAASCGDGFVQAGVEECDDANDDDTDDCPTNCLIATCGDGFVQDGVEECDDADDDDTDACVAGCVAAACGDGLVQEGVEECDDGNPDGGDGCEADCTLPDAVDESGGATTGDTGTGTGADESGTGGSGGPGSDTLEGTGSVEGSGTTGSESDTDSAGALGDGDEGCGCTTDRRPGSAAAFALAGLGLLLRRRRRVR